MASRPELALGAGVLSAALFYLGTGLEPIGWLTWIAPLPVLLLAPRVPAAVAAGVAFVAWLGGELNLWSYVVDRIGMPLPIWLALFTGTAALFAAVVLLTRTLLLRGRFAAAALALPACWAGAEYLFAATSPDGAFWSLAYTQAEVLPVLQIASLTGHVGVTFLVTGLSSVIAALAAPGIGSDAARRVGIAAAVVFTAALGHGIWRLVVPAPAGETRQVALISVRHEPADVATPAGRGLLDAYLGRTRQAAADGADIVVLPEASFIADASTLPMIRRPFERLVDESGATVVVGVGLIDDAVGPINGQPGGYNTAQVFSPGVPAAGYRKHHLLFSEPAVPGDGLVFVPGERGPLGIAICKDMDFPPLARRYRTLGAELMLVPAWDFVIDAWLHSRMAVTRGVANGFAVARAAQDGVLTLSDARGRIVAEASTGDSTPATVSGALTLGANPTLYSRIGDVFAWLCLSGSVLLIALCFIDRRARRQRAQVSPVA